MPIVDLEGIGPIDFPEGVTRQQAEAIIRQHIAAKTARPSLSLPQQAGAVMAGIGRGVMGLPVQMLEGVGGVTGSQSLLDMARGARESDLGKLLLETPENYRGRVASTAGEVVGNLAGMALPGLAGMRGATAMAGAIGMGQGASEQVQRANENRAAGVDVSLDDEAAAARMGAATGLLDLIPLGRLAGTVAPKGLRLAEAAAARGALGITGRALGTGAIEAGTETAQQYLQNLIESGYNPNQSTTEGLGENAIAGGAAGFGIDALLGMLGARTGRAVAGRRDALESVRPNALADANSIGVRSGEGGDPLVEFIGRMQSAETKPMDISQFPVEDYEKRIAAIAEQKMSAKDRSAAELARSQKKWQALRSDTGSPIDVTGFPVESYRKPPPTPDPLTPKEKKAAEAIRLNQLFQQAMPDTEAPIDVQSMPRENYGQGKKQAAAVEVEAPPVEAPSPPIVSLDQDTPPITDRFHEAYKKVAQENYGQPVTIANVQRAMGVTDPATFSAMLSELAASDGRTSTGEQVSLPASTGTKGKGTYKVNTPDGETTLYGMKFEGPRVSDAPLDPDTYRIPTKDLNLDPARFQYKVEGIGQGGVGDELKSVQKWDPKRAGVISVWKDPANGKTYVVNGHHRYELASRMGVPNLRVQYLDAPNAKAARSIGALLNISEGRGTSVDAAKFMRDTGTTAEEMAAEGTSLTSGLAKEATGLANLAPSLFDDVVHGNLSVKRAAIVGQGLDSYTDQKSLIQLAAKKKATDAEVGEMIRLSKGDESTPSIPSEQGGLFGDDQAETSSNIFEVAQLSNAVRQRLSQEKKLFGIVGDKAAASKLGTAGNKIKADANKQISDQANEALIVYDKLSRSESPITQALREGARRIANGESIDTVRDQTYTAARTAVASLLPGSKVGVRKIDARGKKAGIQGVQPAEGQGPVERQSIDTQPSPTPTQYTVDTLRQEVEAGTKPQIALDIFNEMEALGGNGLFSAQLVDSLSSPDGGKSDGSYSNRVIKLALESKSKQDLLRTLNHEAVHGMKQMGLFNDLEWDLLNAAFNPDTSLTEEERKAYTRIYKGDQVKVNEEAIARGIERYAAGQINAPKEAVSVAAKAVGVIDRLGNLLKGKGYKNATDVLQSFRSGEMGRRPAILPDPPAAARTMQQYEKGQYDTQIKNGKAANASVQPTQNVRPKPGSERSTSLADLIDQDQGAETAGEVERQSYAGEKAYAGTPDADRIAANKKSAEEMEKAGLPEDSIRLATGWFRSPYDKKWRTEVADDAARLTPAFAEMPESKIFSKEESLPLVKVLDHPELFKAYPELKDVKVVKRSGFLDFTGGLQGSFNPASNTLTITPYAKDPASTILHEMQHWIQSKEGFATGGNEEMAIKAISPDRIKKIAEDVLKKKETELRDTSLKLQDETAAMQDAELYKNEIDEWTRLEEESLSAYSKWKETKSETDKNYWLGVSNKAKEFKINLAKSVSGIEGDGIRDTVEALMVLQKLKRSSPENLDSIKKSLVRIQKEIADIRSGDPRALERAIKQSGAAYDAYKNIAGEIEARDVQARQNYTPDERKAKRPMESESINPDDVITVESGSSGERYSVVPQLPVAGKTPFSAPDERTDLRKSMDKFRERNDLGGVGLKIRQNMLDMRAGIAEMSRRASKNRGESSDRAITSAEAAVRAYDVAQDQASSALKNGALEFVPGKNGGGYFRSNGDTYNAPATVFKEAYDKGKLDRLFHYLAAERADVLRSEGREKKISVADAAAWKAYGQDADIANYAKRWKTFNDQMVDTLEKSGRIDAITAAKFKRDMYLPFYRVQEGADGSVNFQSSGATLASAPRLEKLKGSEWNIADPTDNIVRNVNTLTSMALKNEAMQRVARDGMQTGFIKQVKEPVAGRPNMKVWFAGKEKHFEVLDPILYESVTASRIPSSTVMTIAGFPSKVLREGVTFDPVFMINNPVRDSMMAWLQGYTDFPMQQIVQSAYKALGNKPSFQRLEKAGVIGNSIRGEGGAAGTGKTLRDYYAGTPGALNKAWKNAQEFSRKSEGITRNTVYEAVMKRTGGDEAQAAYEARELLNFNRRGAHPAVQVINALIPFQNASWQGADVLYRGLKGQGSNPKMQKQLIQRMGMMAGLSGLYAALASQMPEWQNASDEERDANWFLPGGIKIKIPFEAGFFAKIIPERVVAMYMGNDTGKEFMGALSRFIFSTMKMDMIPQGLKPSYEVRNNYSSFRDKAIEPEYMKNKEKSQRFDESTSELAKRISEFTDVLSPLQIDHLLRGYTGAIGTYGMQAMSLLANPEKAKSAMSMVEREPADLPVLGRFFQRADGGKELGDYYDTITEAEQAQNALKAGLDPTEKRLKLAQIEQAARPVSKQIQLLTKAEKQVRSAMATGNMQPDEARPLLREYRRRKTELAKIVNQMAR